MWWIKIRSEDNSITKIPLFLVVIFIALLLSCVKNPTYHYAPPYPISYNIDDNSLTINKDFNTVWTALMEYATSTLFAIKAFEKDSGLLTLQFGAGDPSMFVDCGYLGSGGRPYLTLLQTSGVGDANLDGSMNIFVKPSSTNMTQIKINARYVLLIKDGGYQQTFAFDTGGYDKKQISTILITCQPTHKAEQTILEGIKKIAQ